MPSIEEARNLGRVQGIDSSLADLTLRDGKSVSIEIGGAVQKTPMLKRTIAGSSSVEMSLVDQGLTFLSSALLAEKYDARIDGLHFRYVAASLDPPQISLTFEDRDVAKLREFVGPVKVYAKRGQKDETTRAEFVVSLVKAALGKRYPITCPQLHDKQPIKSERQSKKAKDEAKVERGKGIGDTSGLTVKGGKASKAQIELGDRALRIAEHLNAPTTVMVALIAALIVESEMGSLSSNVLQGTEGKHDGAEHDITGFLTGEDWTLHGAIPYYLANPGKKPYETAQAVQASGAGLASNGAANYGKVETEARRWVEAFSGGNLEGAETVTEPYIFEVKKGEDFWTAIKRLAKEVNWRAFFVAGRFYFIDEFELIRSQVRLAINRETAKESGIERVSFSWEANRPATEVTITAYAKHWTPPPGSVVTLEGYGPASIGFGDAPVKANSKGQKAGISAARKAATGEGRARYLVESIEAPLRDTDVSDLKLVTVKLKKPTAPLPEPANKTTTTAASDASGETSTTGSATAQRVLEFCEGEVGKPYIWGGFGPTGYDCSGFVSKALNVGGFLNGRLTTVTLASFGEAGEGEEITVHDKAHTGDPHTEHVLIEVLGTMFECGGVSGGVGKPNYSASELAEFSTKRHPKGS